MGSNEREVWWVLRAQSGDRSALDLLLQSVQEPLYRYAVSLGADPDMAGDILQETFLRIYKKLPWLREPELFRTWAYRIAHREAMRQLRREQSWAEQVRDEAILSSVPAPPQEESMPEWADRLPQMIAHLAPACRAVIILYYLHELPLADVAAVLGIPVGTVKSRLAYGLDRLRHQVRQDRLAGGAS